MKQVRISDLTMKQASDAFSLSFKEKIELAKLLDKLGVERNGTYRKESEEKEYRVEIRELLSRTEVVNAKSLDEAIDMIMEKYKKEEIVLDAGDFQEVVFEQEQIKGGR